MELITIVAGETREKAFESSKLKHEEQVVGLDGQTPKGSITKNSDGSYDVEYEPPTDLVASRLIIHPSSSFNKHNNKNCLRFLLKDLNTHMQEKKDFEAFWADNTSEFGTNDIKLTNSLHEYIDKSLEILEKTKRLLTYNEQNDSAMFPISEEQYSETQKKMSKLLEESPNFFKRYEERFKVDPKYKETILKRLNLLRRLQIYKIYDYLDHTENPDTSKYESELKEIVGNNYPNNPSLKNLILFLKLQLRSKQYEYSADISSATLAKEYFSRTTSLSYDDYKKYIFKEREETISKNLKSKDKKGSKWKEGDSIIPKFIVSNKPELEKIDLLIANYESLKRQASKGDTPEEKLANEQLLNKAVSEWDEMRLKKIIQGYQHAYEERYFLASATTIFFKIFEEEPIDQKSGSSATTEHSTQDKEKEPETRPVTTAGCFLKALGVKKSKKPPKILYKQNGLYTLFFYVDTPFGTMEIRIDTEKRFDIQKDGTAAHGAENKPPAKIDFSKDIDSVNQQLERSVPKKVSISYCRNDDEPEVIFTYLSPVNSYKALLSEYNDKDPKTISIAQEAKNLMNQAVKFARQNGIDTQNTSEHFKFYGVNGIVDKIRESIGDKNGTGISSEDFELYSKSTEFTKGMEKLIQKYVNYLVKTHPNPPLCYGEKGQATVSKDEIQTALLALVDSGEYEKETF